MSRLHGPLRYFVLLCVLICCVSLSADETAPQNGPTVYIGSSDSSPRENPVERFMYFVPLISPVLAEYTVSEGNTQNVQILSCDLTRDQESFRAHCSFELTGEGEFCTRFDPEDIIARNRKKHPGKPLTNLLDYIKIRGTGSCEFDIKGKLEDDKMTITSVTVKFSVDDKTSPVTVGLYSVKPEPNGYDYRKRYDITVARINSLVFRREAESEPKMGIVLDSVGSGGVSDSLWGVAKGFVANLLIKPISIASVGNQSILDFCYAIVTDQAEFQFPLAQNLKQD